MNGVRVRMTARNCDARATRGLTNFDSLAAPRRENPPSAPRSSRKTEALLVDQTGRRRRRSLPVGAHAVGVLTVRQAHQRLLHGVRVGEQLEGALGEGGLSGEAGDLRDEARAGAGE